MHPPQTNRHSGLAEASVPPGDKPAREDNESHKLQIIVIIIRLGNFLYQIMGYRDVICEALKTWNCFISSAMENSVHSELQLNSHMSWCANYRSGGHPTITELRDFKRPLKGRKLARLPPLKDRCRSYCTSFQNRTLNNG